MGIQLAACAAVILSVVLLSSLWLRLPSWTLVDLFTLGIALYFGAYTLVDAMTAESANMDAWCVLAVFILVATGALILWLATRMKAFPETSLARLQDDWRACPATPLVVIAALSFAFRWYTAEYFNDLGALGEADLRAAEQQLPYWYTSLGMIVSTTVFGVGVCSWGKTRTARGWRRLFWLAMTVSSAALVMGMGRRAILAFLIIVGWTVLAEQRSRRSRGLTIAIVVLAMPVLIGLSNLYQAYRATVYRGVVLENVIGGGDIGSLIEEAIAVERTVSNLQERPSMWRFNYEVIKAHVEDGVSLQWGQLFLGDLQNYIPAMLYPGKEWVDSEDTLLERFGLERYDRPSNLFSYTYADFGALSALIAPALMLLFVWACAVALRHISDPFLRSLLMGMAIFYALNIENSYLVPVGLARDFLVVALLYLPIRALARLLHYGALTATMK